MSMYGWVTMVTCCNKTSGDLMLVSACWARSSCGCQSPAVLWNLCARRGRRWRLRVSMGKKFESWSTSSEPPTFPYASPCPGEFLGLPHQWMHRFPWSLDVWVPHQWVISFWSTRYCICHMHIYACAKVCVWGGGGFLHWFLLLPYCCCELLWWPCCSTTAGATTTRELERKPTVRNITGEVSVRVIFFVGLLLSFISRHPIFFPTSR